MAQELIQYANIPHFPGGEEVVNDFDRLVRLAAKDCAERQEIDKPRKVVLQVELVPDGNAILVSAATKHAFPPKLAGVARAAIDRGGRLVGNPASDDDPKQGTLDEAE